MLSYWILSDNLCIVRNPTKTICGGQNWQLLCVCGPILKHVCIDLVVHYIPKLTIAWNGLLYPSIINLERLGCKLRNIEGSNPLKGTSFYRFVLNVGHTFWVLNIFSCKVLHEEFILMCARPFSVVVFNKTPLSRNM